MKEVESRWFRVSCGKADLELQVTATAQHHKEVWYYISLAWEKIEI